MATKIDKFEGKIDFKKDTSQKIKKTLTELSNYLKGYAEDEAAKIVEEFKGAKIAKSQLDVKEREKYFKAYEHRTKILGALQKDIKKIKEDLINEQANKLKTTETKKPSRVAMFGTKIKETVKEVKDFAKSPFQWLKDAIFGRLLTGLAGKLLKLLTKPITLLISALFAAGKLGAKLIFKGVKSAIMSGLKAGGWLIGKLNNTFKALWSKFGAPKIEALNTKIQSLGKSILNTGKGIATQVMDKAKSVGSKVTNKTKDFFDLAANKLSNFDLTSKAKTVVKSIGSGIVGIGKTTIKGAKNLTGKVSNVSSQALNKVKTKVLAIGSKLITKFGSKGSSKVTQSIAKRLPKALGKFATKFIPGVGIALLAYDVYSAAKKSNSAISFAVNLIDNVSGGLLGLGVQAAIKDFDGSNLGEYVQNIVDGFDFNFGEKEQPLDIDKLSEKLDTNHLNINNQNNKTISEEQKNIYNQYQSGTITKTEANRQLQSINNYSTKNNTFDTNTHNNAVNSSINNFSENSIEHIKRSDINIASMDVHSANNAQIGLTAMTEAVKISTKNTWDIANGLRNQMQSIVQNSISNIRQNPIQKSPLLQG